MHRLTQLGLILLLLCSPLYAADVSHGQWHQLLQDHVQMAPNGQHSQVDYAAIQRNEVILDGYLARLAKVEKRVFDSWSDDSQLAFLINAYNAWTVKLILSRYPKLDSIKDIGFLWSSPWQKNFIPLLGETRSLDDIEHKLIRGTGRYGEPRIHFAVNCASIGCPALLNRAYKAETLDAQLDAVTRNFLSDRQRNGVRKGVLRVSPIFKWYVQDFSKGWQGANSLREYLAMYAKALGLSDAEKAQLISGKLAIEYSDYNWALNALGNKKGK
jgi:hypothetical protein